MKQKKREKRSRIGKRNYKMKHVWWLCVRIAIVWHLWVELAAEKWTYNRNFYACKAHFSQSNCFFVSNNYMTTYNVSVFFLFTPSLHFYGLNCSFVFRFHWITNAHLYSSLVPSRSILNPQYITIIHIIFSLALHHFLDYLINCVHWYGSICCKNYCKIKIV